MINNRITIGYIFESSPIDGGNFQTEISTANRLKSLDLENFKIKFFSVNRDNIEVLKKHNYDLKYIKKK